jgi:hypothetical protein
MIDRANSIEKISSVASTPKNMISERQKPKNKNLELQMSNISEVDSEWHSDTKTEDFEKRGEESNLNESGLKK